MCIFIIIYLCVFVEPWLPSGGVWAPAVPLARDARARASLLSGRSWMPGAQLPYLSLSPLQPMGVLFQPWSPQNHSNQMWAQHSVSGQELCSHHPYIQPGQTTHSEYSTFCNFLGLFPIRIKHIIMFLKHDAVCIRNYMLPIKSWCCVSSYSIHHSNALPVYFFTLVRSREQQWKMSAQSWGTCPPRVALQKITPCWSSATSPTKTRTQWKLPS